MSTKTTTNDVFLSYSMADAEAARTVTASFVAAGIQVFDLAELRPGENLQQVVMKAIAEASALVAVLKPSSSSNPSIAVEIGAAWAWNKPVFVISTDEQDLRPPSFLGDARVYPPSRVDDVIRAIRRSLQPLSDEDRHVLRAVYASLNLSTDNLVQQPTAVDALATSFNRRRHKHVSGERLVQELIRMRKQGRLPRLRNSG